MNAFDVIVAGSGAAGMMAAIVAARQGNQVLLLEKLSKPGAKLKATGGGRCNLTNTLDNTAFMARFGRDGRFMTPALEAFDHKALIAFFGEIGVKTHAPDGYRVFPVTHSAETILSALEKELERLGVEVRCNQKVISVEHNGDHVTGVTTETDVFATPNVVLATGGLGYPQLGAEGDGYALSQQAGHTVTELYPAMMPLKTKETWVEHCRADTIPKVTIRVDLKKAKKLRATGDLIFTKTGIRGPAVLDFARDVTPLLETYGEVPLLINMTKGMSEDDLLKHFRAYQNDHPDAVTIDLVMTLLPEALSLQLCALAHADPQTMFNKLGGKVRDALLRLLAWTPLTVTGHDGFKMAMITRGGVSLKEIRPETMESKLIKGLYFCGELMNLDGPCGGYNLQWSFASGYLAGHLGALPTPQ
ncbi:NAD(P)/FAD-dependent oxidoreductase [Sulfurimonas sp. HSL-3221]|uniref:NAD(P)/FAD-dependent oxidoreductase n=1 Tax=Sulfurimonadaceae TaxID=2771471 RepID=UPI001E5AA6A8|nr:NAD(P)/FAD-dependent oxidoreductase [Sulfurimonas sp. HSL-3221]UFS61943.1 NAD(P)/FAD-dependent oxidoreductase [Sulfurimonas sp. HSL-3221]